MNDFNHMLDEAITALERSVSLDFVPMLPIKEQILAGQIDDVTSDMFISTVSFLSRSLDGEEVKEWNDKSWMDEAEFNKALPGAVEIAENEVNAALSKMDDFKVSGTFPDNKPMAGTVVVDDANVGFFEAFEEGRRIELRIITRMPFKGV